MCANVFFDIPKVQQVDLISKWLRTADIVALDSATCSHKWRPEYLELLRSPELTLSASLMSRYTVGDWVVLRKVTFAEVVLCSSTLSNDVKREALLKVIGLKLKTLHLHCEQDSFALEEESPLQIDQVIFDVTQYCRRLTDFAIYCVNLDGSLSFLLNANPLLTQVTINNCRNITVSTLKSIIKLPCFVHLDIQESIVADAATLPVCEPNLHCQFLNGRNCRISSNVLTWLCQSMPNLLKLHVDVEIGRELECIADHCRQVTVASITIDSGLLVAEARTIANHWQSIELLTLLRPFEKKHLPVCDESVALVFVDKCHSLLQLKLALSDPSTDSSGRFDYARVSYNQKNAEVSKLDNARSRLTDLCVPSLSAQALATIVQKCVYLNTLRIVHPAPVAVGLNAAEFALHHLSGTNIKTLVLTNSGTWTTPICNHWKE